MKNREFILHPAIIDQLKLWELDQNRLQPKEGYLYQQFMNAKDYELVVNYAKANNCLVYENSVKRTLVVTLEGHSLVKNFVKSNLSSQ